MLSLSPTCGYAGSLLDTFFLTSENVRECCCRLTTVSLCGLWSSYQVQRGHDSGHDFGKSKVTEVSSFAPVSLQSLLQGETYVDKIKFTNLNFILWSYTVYVCIRYLISLV